MEEVDSEYTSPPDVDEAEVLELQIIANQHYESQATSLLRLLITIVGLTFTAIFYINQSGVDLNKYLDFESRTTVIRDAVPRLTPAGDSFLILLLVLLTLFYFLWGIRSFIEIFQATVGVLNPERVRSTLPKSDILSGAESIHTLISKNEAIVDATHEAWRQSYEKLRLTGARFVIAGLGVSVYALNSKGFYWFLYPFFLLLIGYRFWDWAPTESANSYFSYQGVVDILAFLMLVTIFIVAYFGDTGPLSTISVLGFLILSIILLLVFLEQRKNIVWTDWHIRNLIIFIYAGVAFYIAFILTMIFIFPLSQHLLTSIISSIIVVLVWVLSLTILAEFLGHAYSFISRHLTSPLRSSL